MSDTNAQSLTVENSAGIGGTIPALDGLRGLAILLVLANHLLSGKGHTGRLLLDLLVELHSFSWVGVNLFFALSGYLITGILRDGLSEPRYFRDFYARRGLRIFPLYFGFLAVLLAVTPAMHLEWAGWQYFYLTYTANLALGWHRTMSLAPFRIVHFWSLQVEEQFYLVWPIVVYRVRNGFSLIRYSLLACVGALVLRIVLVMGKVASQPYNYLPYSFTLCCCDDLLYGCVLALLLRSSWRERVFCWAPLILVLCATPVFVERVAYRGTPWTDGLFMPTAGLSLIGIGSAALIGMALRPGSWASVLFGLSWLRFFGKYSYGLYVFHYSIYGLLGVPAYLFFKMWVRSDRVSGGLSTCVVALLSVGIAMLSYHLYEVHFLKLKQYFRHGSAHGPGAGTIGDGYGRDV